MMPFSVRALAPLALPVLGLLLVDAAACGGRMDASMQPQGPYAPTPITPAYEHAASRAVQGQPATYATTGTGAIAELGARATTAAVISAQSPPSTKCAPQESYGRDFQFAGGRARWFPCSDTGKCDAFRQDVKAEAVLGVTKQEPVVADPDAGVTSAVTDLVKVRLNPCAK